jgi:hypothetical protein
MRCAFSKRHANFAHSEDEVVRARRNFPLFRDRRPDAYGDIAAKPEDLLD